MLPQQLFSLFPHLRIEKKMQEGVFAKEKYFKSILKLIIWVSLHYAYVNFFHSY